MHIAGYQRAKRKNQLVLHFNGDELRQLGNTPYIISEIGRRVFLHPAAAIDAQSRVLTKHMLIPTALSPFGKTLVELNTSIITPFFDIPATPKALRRRRQRVPSRSPTFFRRLTWRRQRVPSRSPTFFRRLTWWVHSLTT